MSDEIEIVGRAKMRPLNPYKTQKVKSFIMPVTAEEKETMAEPIIIKSSAPGGVNRYLEDRDYEEEEVWVAGADE